MATQLSAFPAPVEAEPNKVVITTPERFESLIRFLDTRKKLVIDYETSGLEWFNQAEAVGMGLGAWDDQGRLWNAYVPFRHRTGENQLDIGIIGPAFKRLLGNLDSLKIAHNIKFEDHFSRREGWKIQGPRYDTMVAGRLYNENLPSELEFRAERDLGREDARRWEHRLNAELHELAKFNRLGIKAYLKKFGYSETRIHLCGQYCCMDTDNTGELHTFYEKWGLSKRYPRIWPTEMRLTKILCDMETNGLPVDLAYLQSIKAQVKAAKVQLEAQIKQVLGGYVINLGSDEEVRYLLSTVMGLSWDKRTDGNQLAVDREVLEGFAPYNAACALLLKWRDAEKLDTTYTDSIIRMLDANGLLHGDFKQVGTNTGRLSCEKPNYQNFPSDDDDRAKAYSGKKVEDGGIDPWSIRRAFPVRGPGWVRAFFDYSQIELRVLAYYSRDPVMVDAYLKGEDIHARTAKEVGSILGRECPRRVAKVVNFGLCIAGGQLVLTHVGLVPIERVRNWHLVWDGVEWVTHDGLVCRGECEVVTYDGLTATPEHKVYTEQGTQVAIGELASSVCGLRLAVGETAGIPVRYSAPDGCRDYAWSEPGGGSLLRSLWAGGLGFGVQREGASNNRLQMPGEVSRFEGADIGRALRLYGAALCAGYSRFLETLQGAWDSSALSFEGAFHSVGVGNLSSFQFQGVGVRPDRQQRPVQPREFEADNLQRECPKRTALVYDLLNAGPRHRFTVAGKIVSNSYCLGEKGLASQAKIPEGDARAFLAAFFLRYQGVATFRNELWADARRKGNQWNNIFGRTRRVWDLQSEEFWKAKRAERQMIGSAIQGTAAELTKESLVRLADWIKKSGVPALLVNTVHDEIQIDMPRECLPLVVREAKRLMEDFPEFAPIPIIVDADWTDKTWADKQEYEENHG